jgi:hypothetical protein
MLHRYFLLLLLLLTACSGEDILQKDNTPPIQPQMIQHLGDTGDQIGGVIQNYYINDEFEFNGIDAVQGEDWIKIQWERVSDEDAALIEIYRFNLSDYNYYVEHIDEYDEDYDFTTLIDTLENVELRSYIDSSPGLLGQSWFYYIKVFDEAGNSTKSDTVSYRLVNRPALLYPVTGVVNLDDLEFAWELDSEFSPSQSRLLLFSENRQLLWVYNPLDFDGTQVDYYGDYIPPQTLIWRVDVIADDLFYNIFGTNYHVYSGAESIEYILYLQ